MSYSEGSRPIPPQPRRRSILDIGGPNSLNNFASSYTRAQHYLGSTLIEQGGNLMENEANVYPSYFGLPSDEEAISEELAHGGPSPRGSVSDSSSAVIGEATQLLTPQLSRISTKRSSFCIITGNSTAPQTIFNSVNTLVGIGMLSLPYGFKLSGWLLGSILLVGSALSTNLTAKYLGRILRMHPHLLTYGDVAHEFGGKCFLYFVTFFFVIDLFGASLTLIILFADSFQIVWPHINELKALIVAVVFVLSLLPLNVLSLLSLLGILGTICIIIVIVVCGFLLNQSPGSLLIPATTTMFPTDPKNLLIALGIFMAPWGGHPVFPELYRDMRHPAKYSLTSNISFSITFALDYCIGALGYLMFGLAVNDSVVRSIMNNPHYPPYVNTLLCILMGILPVSKLPLVTKPIITSYENLLGLTPRYVLMDKEGQVVDTYGIGRIVARLVFCIVLLTTALLFTSFGKLVSFLGSAICYTVCLTLPLLFYLRLNRHNIGKTQAVIMKIGVAVSITAAVLGSYASIGMDVPE